MAFKARIGQNLVLGLMGLGVFQSANGTTFKEQKNMAGAMFFLSVQMFMNSYLGTTQVFQVERPVFLREQANQMYGIIPYYTSKMIGEIPVFIVIPILYTPIVYFGIGFTVTWVQYLKFMLTISAEI